MERQQQLGEVVLAALKRKNLNPYSANQRFGISREVITRMTLGKPPALEVAERFARAFDLDVNQFRQLCGYPPVEDWVRAEIRQLRGQDGDFNVSTEWLDADTALPEEAERVRRELRQAAGCAC